jgi:hypothetical protein
VCGLPQLQDRLQDCASKQGSPAATTPTKCAAQINSTNSHWPACQHHKHTHQPVGRPYTEPGFLTNQQCNNTPLPASSHTAAANCAERRHRTFMLPTSSRQHPPPPPGLPHSHRCHRDTLPACHTAAAAQGPRQHTTMIATRVPATAPSSCTVALPHYSKSNNCYATPPFFWSAAQWQRSMPHTAAAGFHTMQQRKHLPPAQGLQQGKHNATCTEPGPAHNLSCVHTQLTATVNTRALPASQLQQALLHMLRTANVAQQSTLVHSLLHSCNRPYSICCAQPMWHTTAGHGSHARAIETLQLHMRTAKPV